MTPIARAYEAGRAAHHWPPAHVAELRRLVAAHKSWIAVSAAMQELRPGIGPDACRMRAARLGITLDARGALWSDDEDEALIDATDRLTGWSAVAARMQSVRPGATRDAVRERARRIGLCDDGDRGDAAPSLRLGWRDNASRRLRELPGDGSAAGVERRQGSAPEQGEPRRQPVLAGRLAGCVGFGVEWNTAHPIERQRRRLSAWNRIRVEGSNECAQHR